MSKVHTGNIQPQLDYEEHVGDARAKRIVLVGTDGANYNEVHVSAAGELSTSGGGGGGGTVDQGTGGVSPWLVKIDQTGTNNDVNVSGTVDVSGSTVTIQEPLSVDDNGGSLTVDGTVAVSNPSVQYTEGDVDTTITGTACMAESSVSSTLIPLQVDANNCLKVVGNLGVLVTNDAANTLDNANFVQDSSPVSVAGYILDESAGTALTENDAAAARIDSKRAQICTIEDETTRGRRVTVTASNALKVDGSAVTQPTTDSQTLADNAGFTDGTSKVFPAGFIFDEVAGTALTENDVAAARVNANRSQIGIIEDGSTRARYATVTAANAVKVDGSAVTQPVSIAATVTVDTELPAAAALADGAANPTTPLVGSCTMRFNQTTWDRTSHSFYQNRTGVVTGSGPGTTVDMTTRPMSKFALQIEKQSGTVSAWNLDLEASIDGSTFLSILNNTSATGNTVMVFVVDKPVRYMRSNVTTITGLNGTVRIRILASEA